MPIKNGCVPPGGSPGMGLAVELAQIHITAHPLARTARENRLHRAPTRRRGHGRGAELQGTVPGLVTVYLARPLSTRRSGDRRAGDGLSHIDTSSQNEKSCLTPPEEGKGARV